MPAGRSRRLPSSGQVRCLHWLPGWLPGALQACRSALVPCRRHQASIQASASREQVSLDGRAALAGFWGAGWVWRGAAGAHSTDRASAWQEASVSRRSASLVAVLTACTVASPAHALLGVGGPKKDPIEEYKENTVRGPALRSERMHIWARSPQAAWASPCQTPIMCTCTECAAHAGTSQAANRSDRDSRCFEQKSAHAAVLVQSSVIQTVQSSLAVGADDPKHDEAVAKIRDVTKDWVATYRKGGNYTGRPSYGCALSARMIISAAGTPLTIQATPGSAGLSTLAAWRPALQGLADTPARLSQRLACPIQPRLPAAGARTRP